MVKMVAEHGDIFPVDSGDNIPHLRRVFKAVMGRGFLFSVRNVALIPR